MTGAVRELNTGIAAYKALDYSGDLPVLEDALLIDTENPYADLNTAKWRLDSEKTIDMPPGCRIGFREYYYYSETAFAVKVLELYPTLGRTWCNYYDKPAEKWVGWIANGLKQPDFLACTLGEKFVGGAFSYIRDGICIVSIEASTSSDVENGDIVATNLPKTANVGAQFYLSLGMSNGNVIPAILSYNSINDAMDVVVYYPGDVAIGRIDSAFTYFI